MNRFINFLKDVKVELSKVSWPTRQQTLQYTIVVIAMSLLVSLFLSGWDAVFGFALNKLLLR